MTYRRSEVNPHIDYPFYESFNMMTEYINTNVENGTIKKPFLATQKMFENGVKKKLGEIEQTQKDLGYNPTHDEFMEVWNKAQEGLKKHLSTDQMDNIQNSFNTEASALGAFGLGAGKKLTRWFDKGKNIRVPAEDTAKWKELLKDSKKQLTRTDKAFKAGKTGLTTLRPWKAFSPSMLGTGPDAATRQLLLRGGANALKFLKVANPLSLLFSSRSLADGTIPEPGTPEYSALMDKADKGWDEWNKSQESPHEQVQDEFYDWRNKGLLFNPYESMSSGLGGRNRASVAAAKEAAAAEAAAAAAAEEERKRKAQELQDYLDSLKEEEPVTPPPSGPPQGGPHEDEPVITPPPSGPPPGGPHANEPIISGPQQGGPHRGETTITAQTQSEAEVEAVVQTQSNKTQTAAITTAASNSQASYEQEAFGGGGRTTATKTTAVTGRPGSGGGGGGRATTTKTTAVTGRGGSGGGGGGRATATTTGGGASKSSGDWKHLFK